jgi:hypothetical protein
MTCGFRNDASVGASVILKEVRRRRTMATTKLPLAAVVMLIALLLFLPKNSFAACSIPHQLTNGQVADATAVMDDVNAVAACADAAVVPTGTPQAGAVTVFTGPNSITSGDLTGDVTTSGGTATSLSPTGVTPGTYNNASVTVDSKGRVTAVSSGAGVTSFTKYTVAQGGDAFIDVPLAADGGFAYHVFIKGVPSANAGIGFRISSDNGATFYSGSGDYKWGTTGSDSYVNISAGSTVGSGRETLIDFTLAGMNVVATDRFDLTGGVFSILSSGTPINGHIGGTANAVGSNNFNAFRIFALAGTMDGFAVYVGRLY